MGICVYSFCVKPFIIQSLFATKLLFAIYLLNTIRAIRYVFKSHINFLSIHIITTNESKAEFGTNHLRFREIIQKLDK